MEKECLEKVDPIHAKSVIGWISYDPIHMVHDLGVAVSRALDGYSGPVIAIDVYSKFYQELGMMFASAEVPKDIADKMFEACLHDAYEWEDYPDDEQGEE